MPDITVCTNKTCPLKDKCYRATAEWDEYRQSICSFKPKIVDNKTECDYYWDNSNR